MLSLDPCGLEADDSTSGFLRSLSWAIGQRPLSQEGPENFPEVAARKQSGFPSPKHIKGFHMNMCELRRVDCRRAEADGSKQRHNSGGSTVSTLRPSRGAVQATQPRGVAGELVQGHLGSPGKERSRAAHQRRVRPSLCVLSPTWH